MHDILRSARQYKKEGNLCIMDIIKQAWRDYDFFLSYQDEEERDRWKNFDILVKTKDKVEKVMLVLYHMIFLTMLLYSLFWINLMIYIMLKRYAVFLF